MLLSISDGLLELLITELKRQNSIDKHKQFSSFDTTKYKNRYKLGFEKKIQRCWNSWLRIVCRLNIKMT